MNLTMPEPAGPIEYVLIREVAAGEWRIVGGLWLVDQSIGFESVPGLEDQADRWARPHPELLGA